MVKTYQEDWLGEACSHLATDERYNGKNDCSRQLGQSRDCVDGCDSLEEYLVFRSVLRPSGRPVVFERCKDHC
jgi:hypothetical protein